MEQWARFLFDLATWTVALLATFEGTRRIASGRRSRRAVVLLVIGMAWCVLRGGVALNIADSLDSMAEAERGRTINDLGSDWGSKLSPLEREKGSLAYAATAFNSTGRLFEYFNQSGERALFTPTQQQLRERDATVELWRRVENTSADAHTQGLRWLLSAVVALIAGMTVGAKNDG